MWGRLAGTWRARRALLVPLLFAAAAAAGCSSGSPTGTGTGGGTKGIHVTGTASAPTALNVPGGGTDSVTPDQLAAALDASQPVPAAQAGAFGIVTATTASGFTLEQRLVFGSPSDSASGAVIHNYAPLGTPGSDLTVTTNSSTTFENGTTLASIPVGALVAIGGTGSGTNVTANYVAVLDSQGTTARSTYHRPSTQQAPTPPATEPPHPRLASVVDTVPGVLGLVQNFPPQSIKEPVVVWSPTGNCPAVQVRSQLGVGFGLRFSFPYDLMYEDHPPLYSQNGGTWIGPGLFGGWMALEREPPAGNALTVNYGGGLSVGVTLDITGCDGRQLQLGSASSAASFFIGSTLTKPMPGTGETDTLVASDCQAILSIPLFVHTGEASLSDFSVSNFQIVICDPATITGAPITATLTDLLGGTGGTGQFVFDPVNGIPTTEPTPLMPNDTTMLFRLSSLSYAPTFQDRFQITATLFGQTLPNPSSPLFVPRTLTATALPEFMQIYSTAPGQICAEVPGDQFDDAAYGAINPSCSTVVNHGTGNHTGTITVNAAELCNAPYCPSSTPDQTVSSTVTISVRESGYQGVFRALDVPGAVPQVATVLNAVYNGDATLCGDPAYGLTNPVSISGPQQGGNASEATFTITIGSWSTGHDLCHIYLVDDNYAAVLLNLRFLGGSGAGAGGLR